MTASSSAALAIRLLRRQYEEATEACDAAYHETYRQDELIKGLERQLTQARFLHEMAVKSRDTHQACKAEFRAALEGLGVEDL